MENFKYIVGLRIAKIHWYLCKITGTQMVYIAQNIICSKTTGPICICLKLDCRGCGCVPVDFNVFGVFLSGAVKQGFQVHLSKTKYLVRQKTLI